MSDAKPVPDAKAVPDSKAVPDAKAVPNAKAPSRMLDAQFITSYKNLTFDETRRQVYLRRYSEYSPVWETWQTFNRADFINPLVLDTQAWYTESADRAITLRMEMTLKLCGLEIIKPVLVVPVLKKQHSPYLHWGVGDVTLQKDQEIAESGQDYAYRAKFRWTRVFNNTVQLSPFRARGLTADADGVLVGDIDLNTLANAGIATWELMIVRLQLAPGYQGKACLEDARMLVTFRDKNVAESVEVKKKLNFESQDLGVDKNSNGKVVFSCDLQGVETEDEPWFGPQAVPPTPDIPDPQPVKGPLLEVKKERKIRPLTPNGSFYAQHTKWKLYNGVEPYTGYAFDVEGKPIPYYYEESAEGRITDGPTTVAEMEAKDLEFDRQSLKQAAKRQRVAREKAAAELDELLGDLRASKDATPASSATSTARTGTQPTTIKQPAVQGSAASKSVTPTPVATKSSTPAPPSAGSGAANIATTAKQPTPPSSQAPASTALTKPAAVKPASSMPGSTPSNTTSTAPASSAPASQPVATAPAGAIGGSAAKTTTPSSKGGK
ncbi:hypothetical protein BDY17DRAFT_97149 [Neohortaea acidophila]|uniref:Uncharacterized protein n=1 Tax=Neohortaea acidophila TaxID=245834 RepID=A0A6A6PZE2_9PEZI|nr:uncharacterized protein BDY17DRAFT_97149 [Neohortaea acidophila]KAF2485131.1 hypothetical protein BDY17DRAFT_97149 [Neohortaea acidophila]